MPPPTATPVASLYGQGSLRLGQSTQELPQSLNASLQELRQVLGSLNPDSPLYDRLDRTLTELNRTLQSVGATSRTVGDQPSSILFSTPTRPDPEPRGAQ